MTLNGYVPSQGDIVMLNFFSTSDTKSKKRRPALVISNSDYNRLTNFCAVCPITSYSLNKPMNFKLKGYKTSGQVVTSQFRTMDFSFKAARKIEFVEKIEVEEFAIISQMIHQIFQFDGFQP